MSRARRLVSAFLAGGLAAAAGMAFEQTFRWQDLVPLVAAATAIPLAICLVLFVSAPSPRPSPRRGEGVRGEVVGGRPLWWSLVIGVTVWLVVVSVTLFRSPPSPGTIATVVSSLGSSWKAILTVLPPVPARPQYLVLAHALVWAAALAGVEIALRTRAALAPALPALVVFVVALPFGAGGAGSLLAVGVVLVGLAGAMALVRGPAPLRTALPLWLPGVAALALVAGLLGPNLPLVQARQPFDPRQQVAPPPPDLQDSVNPLDEVSAWLQNPASPLFAVQASSGQNWRLATLDQFDGVTWSRSGRLLPSGGSVPRPQPGRGGAQVVTQRVTIQGLAGDWLPAADRPTLVSGLSVDVDTSSGVLVGVDPLHPGARYQVVSAVPTFTAAQLLGARPAADAAARADLALPPGDGGPSIPQPVELQRYAQTATAGSDSAYQQAVLLADYLRANEVYDVTAPPGHSYRDLEFFMTTSHHGTSEQFATTYALMARTLGLPSRVVVGFKPGQARGGTYEVLAGDVLVWPEVDFQGLGWVPFYPTPDQAGPTSGGPQAVATGQAQAQRAVEQALSGNKPSPSPTPTPRPARRNTSLASVAASLPLAEVAAAVAGLAVLVYLVLVVLVPPWRRRRRRWRATSQARVLGAWQEAVDQLRHLGLPPVRTLSAHDVAGFGASTVGEAAAGHLVPLARAVNQARFAAEPTDEVLASSAWIHSDALRRLVAQATPVLRRLRRRLDPRSLRGSPPM